MEEEASRHSVALVLDFGSQYTHLITRRIRQLGVCSFCLSAAEASLDAVAKLAPSLILLSGGPHSVYEPGAPSVPPGFFDYVRDRGVPVVGICYGLQLIVAQMGGSVEPAANREYGSMDVVPVAGSVLYGDDDSTQSVWMSHGDEVVEMPRGFVVVARSVQGSIAAIENPDLGIYALQYHPEVSHSPKGIDTLKRLLFEVGGLTDDWKVQDVLQEQIDLIATTVGPDDHAICALSGGVDSTVAATIVHKVMGDRLHCVFVDNGLLRYKERERVMETFKRDLHLPVVCVDAGSQFLAKLEGVVDPERKRKIIGAEFIAVFDEFSRKLEQELGKKPKYLVQGTLYPDVIESCPPPGVVGHSHTIKSHHNVGGLPPSMKLLLLEPLKWLFKDEVRKLGKLLGIPEGFLKRHPFPGPGLAVRVIGGDVTEENLETLRLVDEVFTASIKEAGLYDEMWQAFAGILPVKTVGVQGDKRTHSGSVVLRAVTSEDGMTAERYTFKREFLDQVTREICNTVVDVNRVFYDLTSKPPATIEWE
ncbi:hypothetical protein SELMODRAFT_120847 [Selaginella moellendorffii]|uniref:GMP synthase [glutamine-hydrolyzing] n=1 Tax=Selaginella moellendorffii TaxID=88036 RepID=D8SN11_SELML|nr:uncharacterized protein LOC9644990 [Selaginella moellendorffii]EFJ14271.1 hypothetical protein SELMODRAFT_120847 [Selaginella moellendorffii]|eukprot:XP_002984626.1 uncharacterized protein LOC9644990 [Selaginella moellendorffii]